MRLAAALLPLLLAAGTPPARAASDSDPVSVLIHGLGRSDAALKTRLYPDVLHYYTIKAFAARDPSACAPAGAFKLTLEVDDADGDLACRRRYYALLMPYAFSIGDPGAREDCLRGMMLNQLGPNTKKVARICSLLAESYTKPFAQVCAGDLGLKLSPGACRQRLGEKHGDRAACARITGMSGVSRRRELCDGMADYTDARRAGDANKCGGSEVCLLYMGKSAQLLASYRDRLLAAARGARGAAGAPAAVPVASAGRRPEPKTVDEALTLLAYTNSDEPDVSAPASAASVELGRLLFFDKRLSLHRDFSCASCHKPDRSWSDGLPRARGAGGQELPRRTLSLLKIGYYNAFMWDGRAATLEDQILIPLQSPDEMGMKDLGEMTRRLSAVPQYRRLFAQADGGNAAITPRRVLEALKAFERSIAARQGESRFERFQTEHTGLTASEQHGFILFMGKARCSDCHLGLKLTYGAYENSGVRSAPGLPDLGRFVVVPEPRLKGAFRTPTLFDVAETPPYMHNGSLATLHDVVEFYNRGGDDKSNLSPLIRPLGLTPSEVDDVVAFLGTLSRPAAKIDVPVVPQ